MSEQAHDDFLKYVYFPEMKMYGSWINSPLASLHPANNAPYMRRRKALDIMIAYMTHPEYQDVMQPRRAVEWIAVNDLDPILRQVARRALGLTPEYIGDAS